MKTLRYAQTLSYLKELSQSSLDEVILTWKKSSKFSLANEAEFLAMIEYCCEKSINFQIDWDVLLDDKSLNELGSKFKELDKKYNLVLRVSDPGAIHFALESLPNSKIVLNLEIGSHNLKAISSWVKIIGKRLYSIVLSTELTREKIFTYLDHFKEIDFEILGIGRILLFNSPRSLITPHNFNSKSETEHNEISASSEETAHKGFKVVENQHGTFMFNTRDFSILEHREELKLKGLKYLRVDDRFHPMSSLDVLINNWPSKVYSGFYRVNKTDILFKKLKNQNLEKLGDNNIASVVDYKKDKYLAIEVYSPGLNTGQEIYIYSPDGKSLKKPLKWIKNLEGKQIQKIESAGVYLINPFSGFSTKSKIFTEDQIQ